MSDQSFSGWKALTYDAKAGLLMSPSQRTDWRPKTPLQAHCGIAHDLRPDSPRSGCSCGIYTRAQIDYHLGEYMPHNKRHRYQVHHEHQISVLAELSLWGWVMEGTTGFRAEYAYPRTILLENDKYLEVLRDTYDVPCIVVPEAFDVAFAEERGKVKQVQVDLSKYSKAQLDMARHQVLYHKWYNKNKQLQKKLDQWERTYAMAPSIIAELRKQLAAHTANKPRRS